MITEKTEKFLLATTDDDSKYYIYNAHDLIEQVEREPRFVDILLDNLARVHWCQAFDMNGRPVWIRTSTIVKVEYKEVKIRKG